MTASLSTQTPGDTGPFLSPLGDHARRGFARLTPLALLLAAVLVGLLVIAWHQRGPATVVSPGKVVTVTHQLDFSPAYWRYMPGAVPQVNGVAILPTDYKIVEQDGSGGQPNYPINLYGPHLVVTGDWSVAIAIADRQGDASFQIYNAVPVIADEFRIEPASVRLTLSGASFRIRGWDGSAQADLAAPKPIFDQTYPISRTAASLSLTKQGSVVSVVSNQTTIAQVPVDHIFVKPELWFGADSSAGGFTLTAVRAQPLHGATMTAVYPTTAPVQLDPKGLQALAQARRPGFEVGAAVALAPLVADAGYAREWLGNFGSLTPENALKWQFTEPQPGTFTFQEADALVAIAAQNHRVVHGHNLVFSEANPAWVQQLPTQSATDKAHVQQVMTDHITTTVSHFKGKIASWDVVNEPLADYDTFDPSSGLTLRSNVWYQAMGADYIAIALRTAHAADPNAKLYLNDYGLEADGERWDAFVALVKTLLSQQVPLDGVGFESHVYTADDVIDTAVLRRHIDQLGALGLSSRISEMDVYDDDGEQVQADQYVGVFTACLTDPHCVSFTTWGVDNTYDVFQDDQHQLQHGKDLLFDYGTPTLAYRSLQASLQH